MKKILVLAALAALAFSSCSKKEKVDEYGYTIKHLLSENVQNAVSILLREAENIVHS